MERWYTADLHFGHTKLVERGYRPFGSVEEMNETLIETWNSVVADRDEVWVLGDFAMRPFDESLGCGLRLRGRKILVPGNHDRCFKGRFSAPRLHGCTHSPPGDVHPRRRVFPYRLARSMRQRDLAESVEVGAPHISKIESGR